MSPDSRPAPAVGHGGLRECRGFFATLKELLFTNRETPAVAPLTVQGVVLASLVGLFAFIGPFGTYDTIGHVGRAGYWALALGVNWLVCGSLMTLMGRRLSAATWSRRALLIACVSALAALPGTGVVYTAEALFRPGYVGAGLLATIYPSVAVLMFAVSTLVVVVSARRASTPAKVPVAGTGGTDGAAFLRRLPEKAGCDLVCLKMADHYVEVFTTGGSTLVLMRFADAVAELQGADGLRVHRSHWVARRHVVNASRRNGRTILQMTGGHEIPVSRGYLADVRAAGLA